MQHDVLVIGGGPSGSTAANLLARGGAKVLLLEKERFPRFHIGESLLPRDVGLFDRLGLDLSSSPRHLLKAGAEFFEEAAGKRAIYPFADSLGSGDYAYQVDRATFDHSLLEKAEAAGVEVRQGEAVMGVVMEAEAVAVITGDGRRHQGRYLIDATGQEALLARRHRSRRRIEGLGLAAVFRHYELRASIAVELARTGNIKVLFVENGWLWAIPLGEQRLSVGLVTREKGIREEWLDRAIVESAELGRLLSGARADGPHRRVGSFSFHNERPHGARWVCVGDAACFLDPVFSSGVSLAMGAAEHVADLLGPALREGREGDPALMDEHAAHMAHAYDVFGTLILSLYQRRLLPGLFFTADQDPELRRGLTTVLAGDVWRRDNRFQETLMQSARRRFALSGSKGLAQPLRG